MGTRARWFRFGATAVVAAAIALSLAAGRGAASTVYGPGGLGEPSLEEGARIRALGGAGVAEHGPIQFSLVNPASTTEIRTLLLQATILPSYRQIDGKYATSETASETVVPSFRAAVRFPLGMVLGGAYAVGTDARFRADRPESAGTVSALRIEGTGGLQLIRLSLAKAIGRTTRVGFDYEIVAGSFREEWNRNFADTSLTTMSDTVEVRYDRVGRWRIGGQQSLGSWTLGGVYETKRELPMTITQRGAGSTIKETGRSLTIPDGWVVGLSGMLTTRLHVATQYRRANWKRESLQSDLVDFRPMQRYSFGLERVGSSQDGASWASRLPIRLGVSYLEWPDLMPLDGETTIAGGSAGVNELTFSLGTGMATQDKGGGIDFTIEAGKRGDKDALGVSERFVRAALTLQVGDDTWK
ncbi:MAG TPA: hypothetical protein VFS09_03980 [Candidatus Eisenbacteria bacterium]|nr:hypothetical protein [Candidatus Eisenbacteria bacterium]